jgi:cell wall-associated NlpC family hydrolase
MRMSQLVRRASTAGLILALTALPLLNSQSAHGDEIGDLQSRANQISQQMTDLQNQIFEDTNAVEAARYKASQIDAEISAAKAKLAEAKRSEDASRRDLSRFALQAYVTGGSGGVDLASLMSTDGNQIGQRQGYVSTAVGDRQQLVDDYEATQQVTKEQRAALDAARSQAADVQAQAEAKQASAKQAADQLAAMKSQLDGKLATLVAEKQAAEQRAAEQRARAEAQAQAQAQAAAAAQAQADAAASRPSVPAISTVPTETDSPPSGGGGGSFVPPPNASAAAIAIAAAQSQLGVPYVWGGATPGVGFDCSGLTMWAYAQAGVSLSHLTYSQEGEGRVVPLSQIQPGDLVFYWNAGHVALYVGGGSVIHAPHTGDVVRYGSLYMGTPELVVRPTG